MSVLLLLRGLVLVLLMLLRRLGRVGVVTVVLLMLLERRRLIRRLAVVGHAGRGGVVLLRS